MKENEFRGFYVAFEAEPKSNACDETKIKTLLENYNKSVNMEEHWVGQEEEIERGLDLVANFHSRVDRCSDQLIRYNWKGLPLFFDKKVNPPLCRTCGTTTFFEFQLMPNILNTLEPEQESLDFLTVFGYTCENCDEVHLVIQREEPLNIEFNEETKQQKNTTQNKNVAIKINNKKKIAKKIQTESHQQQPKPIVKEGEKKIDTRAIHSLMDSFMLGKAKTISDEIRI